MIFRKYFFSRFVVDPEGSYYTVRSVLFTTIAPPLRYRGRWKRYVLVRHDGTERYAVNDCVGCVI